MYFINILILIIIINGFHEPQVLGSAAPKIVHKLGTRKERNLNYYATLTSDFDRISYLNDFFKSENPPLKEQELQLIVPILYDFYRQNKFDVLRQLNVSEDWRLHLVNFQPSLARAFEAIDFETQKISASHKSIENSTSQPLYSFKENESVINITKGLQLRKSSPYLAPYLPLREIQQIILGYLTDNYLQQSQIIQCDDSREIRTVRFSPNNKLMAGITDKGYPHGFIKIWLLDDNSRFTYIKTISPIGKCDLIFLPDDIYLIAEADDNIIKLWQFVKQCYKKMQSLDVHEDNITSLRFSSNGKYLISNSLDHMMISQIQKDKNFKPILSKESCIALKLSTNDNCLALRELGNDAIDLYKFQNSKLTKIQKLMDNARFLQSISFNIIFFEWQLYSCYKISDQR